MLVFHTAWAHNGIHLWAESTSDARLALNDLLGSRGREIHPSEDLEEALEGIEAETARIDNEESTEDAGASNNAARKLNRTYVLDVKECLSQAKKQRGP